MTELSLRNFAEWQKQSQKLAEAKMWIDHIGKNGRGSDILRISPDHCKGLKFTIAGQYTTGGQNYWESPEAFNDAMKRVVLSRFQELAAIAVGLLEKETAASLVKAESEVNAIQDAIGQAKTGAVDIQYAP